MRRGTSSQPGAGSSRTKGVRGAGGIAEGTAVGRLDGRGVAGRGGRVRGLGQLGDVVEVDVVLGAVGRSHYGLQTLS